MGNQDAQEAIDRDQLQSFAQSLRRIGMLCMKIAVQLSTAQERLSKQELLALGVLGLGGPCRMGEIAEHLGVGQSAVTPLVDRLEHEGLVRRRRSGEDRRVWLVELTENGRSVVAEEERVYFQMASEMLGPLSPAERESLMALLERVGMMRGQNQSPAGP